MALKAAGVTSGTTISSLCSTKDPKNMVSNTGERRASRNRWARKRVPLPDDASESSVSSMTTKVTSERWDELKSPPTRAVQLWGQRVKSVKNARLSNSSSCKTIKLYVNKLPRGSFRVSKFQVSKGNIELNSENDLPSFLIKISILMFFVL